MKLYQFGIILDSILVILMIASGCQGINIGGDQGKTGLPGTPDPIQELSW